MPRVTVYIRNELYDELKHLAKKLGYRSRRSAKYPGWMRLLNELVEEGIARKKMVLEGLKH